MPDTLQVHTGEEVEVEHIGPHDRGARFEIEAEDGRRWKVHVDRDGSTRVLTSWRGDDLADLDTPEWLLDVTARLTQV